MKKTFPEPGEAGSKYDNAEEALRELEEKYRTLFEAIDEGFAVCELIRNEQGKAVNWKWIELNPALEKLTGLKHKDTVGKLMTDVFRKPDEWWLRSYESVVKTGKPARFEYYTPYLGYWLSITAFPYGGNRFAVLYDNITKRKQAEQQLRDMNERLEHTVAQRTRDLQKSKDLLQSVFDTTLNVITVHEAVRSENGELVDFRYTYNNALSIPGAEANTTGNLYSVVHPDIKEKEIFRQFKSVVETGVPADFELNYNNDNTPQGWYRIKAVKLGDGLVAAGEDITLRKKTELELIGLKLRQQKEILNAIIIAQEQERERIGESLHNGVAQLLYGIKTRCESLRIEDPASKLVLADVLSLLSDAIVDTRHIAFELVPAVLKDFGLEAALRSMFEKIIGDKPHIHLSTSGLNRSLPEALEIATYRIVQELVNNIVKHAKVTEACVKIRIGKNKLSLEVSDNGIGFNESEINTLNYGIGLQSVKNRVKLLDGKIRIESQVSKGTKISITMPVNVN